MERLDGPPLTARRAGLVACTQCTRVQRPAKNCERCAAPLHAREYMGLQRVWAWLTVGLLLYIPANTYPMLLTSTLGSTSAITILGGVVELVQYGSYFIALIVFVASVAIPVMKFAVIAYLALSLKQMVPISAHQRLVLFEVVEFIGRWSMIDVFVVAILSALVQLGFVATVNPGPAAACFALSVVFTMLSAQSFDPRLIWDASEETPEK
ncbi:MAG: paraquat-inducible protein A [Pseudomonadota bacterium]